MAAIPTAPAAPMATAKRRVLPAMEEPSYSIEKVPRAKRDLRDSVVTRVHNRRNWLQNLPECLMVCNEAERRFNKSGHERAPGTGGKPLSLEYLADRLDTDGVAPHSITARETSAV
eukprot:SAG11_NODE_2297_length_3553_cov_3.882455_1_plen_116_part_00